MTTHSIRLLLVDDQMLFRQGLRALLSSQPDLEVIGEAGDGEEAQRAANRLHPDVALMDLRMPLLDGVSATRRLRESQPECRVIVLTTFDDDEYVFDALRAGAVGYLLKDVPAEKLFEAIRAAARGESFLQPSVAAKVVVEFTRLSQRSIPPSESLSDPLSERELQILRIMASGATNRQIAERLFISPGTARNHVTSILGKLGVSDRAQAVIRARELGLT
jgi:DNA-binding NarL/FixJ family response regulator